jgi:hypothetical protein
MCHRLRRYRKPRGLRWVDCDFDNDVTYACNHQSRHLPRSSLAIRFGPSKAAAWKTSPRFQSAPATTVFEFNGKQWRTLGG